MQKGFLSPIYGCFCMLGATLLSIAVNVQAQETAEQVPNEEIAQMSIEELINLEVTSPSKKPERFSDVASAIYVITQDDIRRSGATTIPQVLRMVPGLGVLQIDESQWAISARGFTGVFGDKLLVLMDGRSVYTPLFGGVFWNEVDTFLQDIERIEVIRGPGATLYGANAVNGVINIITKKAKETQGVLTSAGAGTIERYFAETRYGGNAGDTDYRVYAKYFNRDENRAEPPLKAHDTWQGARTGFRADTELDGKSGLTVQGDAYYGESGWDFLEPTLDGAREQHPEIKYVNGANTIVRWNREFSKASDMAVQFYYDHIGRDDQVLVETRDTFDLDFQHRFELGETHNLMYGTDFRLYQDNIDGSFSVDVEPSSRTLGLYTGFIQDEITVVPSRLRFIAGTKLEHNELSGLEVLPNTRLVYTPNDSNTIWGAFSRGVRAPTRFNQDGRLVIQTFPESISPGGAAVPPTAVTLHGVDSYDAEYVYAYELGYRAQLDESLSFDLATFYNDYDNLESAEPAGDPFLNFYAGRPFIEVPFQVENRLQGATFGGETVLDWRPMKQWRLVGSYSYINIDLRRSGGSQDEIYMGGEHQYPAHQFMIRSQLQLPHQTEIDAAWRYVGAVGTFDIPSYMEIDVQLAWRPAPHWQLALVGQNLMHDDHLEFTSNLVDTQRTGIQRAAYGRVTYNF